LDGLDFVGTAGEIIGILGSNGAGKSTFCKLVSGILKPDEGSIEVRGTVFSLLSLGTGFRSDLSGRENALLYALTLGWSKQEAVTSLPDIIEFAELGPWIDQPLRTYSSGMKARLAFSVAVMARPDILVIDEALGVGDAGFTTKAAEKMQELVSQARLVLVVTHQMDFVRRHCTRAIWIDQGRVRTSGAPDEVVEEYKRFTLPPKTPILKSVRVSKTKAIQSGAPVLSVKGIGVSFPVQTTGTWTARRSEERFWALRNVTFEVKQGDIVGIVGRNGAGKTTLCRVLGGILKPDEGSLQVSGATSALLSLGAGFNYQLTGRDNILLNGMMLGIPKAKLMELYGQIVDFSGLAGALDRPLKQYSRGMIARLAFSIASHLEPDILIVDEALAVGDSAFYERASAKMQELIDKAKAVIVVTHDLSFVQTVCTRALWLEGGTLRLDGNPSDVVAAYKETVLKRT